MLWGGDGADWAEVGRVRVVRVVVLEGQKEPTKVLKAEFCYEQFLLIRVGD